MLAGKKPLTRFVKEHVADHLVGDEGFQDAVERGLIRNFVVDAGPVENCYSCLPTEEWRVKIARVGSSRAEVGASTEDDLHRMDGALLGYRKADVERFIARVRAMKPSS